MKVKHTRPLRRDWSSHPAAKLSPPIYEADLKVKPRGRLKAKLLVFASPQDMRRYWRGVCKARGEAHQLGGDTVGFVKELGTETIVVGKRASHTWRCDPRYFCVICLAQPHIGMETITHEAVHAGIAYAVRGRRSLWPAGGNEDEGVAYPTGVIAAAINKHLYKAGLYDD
jgi:hypothetical protein